MDELNIRIEVPNDNSADMEVDVEHGEQEVSPVIHDNKGRGQDVEDGECSSLSESQQSDMEVDNGMLADVESSPFSAAHSGGRNPQSFRKALGSKKLSSELGTEEGSSVGEGPRGPRQYANPYRTDEGKKRALRAQRFHDSPFRFQNEAEQPKTVSDEELLALYKSCDLFNSEDWAEASLDTVGTQYRLDSILIRGINKMSTDEIFSYLYEMGLIPQAIEWVNDACCIAVYKDKHEAASSLLQVTKPISVDHDVIEKKKNLEIEDKPIPDEGENEVLKDVEADKEKTLDYDSVSIIPYDLVKVPMPLGYVWRYAKPCEKATGILMRYATIQDKKQERAERYSEYYKKHGNPNFNSDEGHRRKKPFKRVRYNPSPEISSSEEEVKEPKKFNVWSKLSADWQDEEGGGSHKSRAVTPIPRLNPLPSVTRRPYYPLNIPRFGNTSGGSVSKPVTRHRSVFEKLDISRKRVWDDEDDDLEEKRPERSQQFFTAGHDSDEEWTARLKGPTMRMHADAEESRQKLQATRKRLPKPSISSRLGEKVDLDTEDHLGYAAAPPRRSIKERLGVRSRSIFKLPESRAAYVDDEVEEENEDAYLESLLNDD